MAPPSLLSSALVLFLYNCRIGAGFLVRLPSPILGTQRLCAQAPLQEAEYAKCVEDWVTVSQLCDVQSLPFSVTVSSTTSPAGALAQFYDVPLSEDQSSFMVSPFCAMEAATAVQLSEALTKSCSVFGGLFHPASDRSGASSVPPHPPHLVWWRQASQPAPLNLETRMELRGLSDKTVMEGVFLWLQQTLLGYNDDDEQDFVDLGRKLLTVSRHVVSRATSETELCSVFWREVETILSSPAYTEGQEDSVLLAMPGFKGRADFKDVVRDSVDLPLAALSKLAPGGRELIAEAFAGGSLKFPVILLSPQLEKLEQPEEDFRIITSQGEITGDEYLQKVSGKQPDLDS